MHGYKNNKQERYYWEFRELDSKDLRRIREDASRSRPERIWRLVKKKLRTDEEKLIIDEEKSWTAEDWRVSAEDNLKTDQ